MPLGVDWATFTVGDSFDENAIIDRFRALEHWINGGIKSDDLKDDEAWVESRHIFKPEFYGSPAPRVEAVSGDTHYRYRPFNVESRYYRHEQGGWYKHDEISSDPDLLLEDAAVKTATGLFTPVEGMAASIHLDEPSLVTVTANWYAWDSGGDTGYVYQRYKNLALDDRVAMFRLFYQSPDSDDDDIKEDIATTRALYCRSDTGYFFRRQNFSTTWMNVLDAGTHHVWIGMLYILLDVSGTGYLDKGGEYGTGHRVKHIYVDGRNFVLDATRLYTSDD